MSTLAENEYLVIHPTGAKIVVAVRDKGKPSATHEGRLAEEANRRENFGTTYDPPAWSSAIRGQSSWRLILPSDLVPTNCKPVGRLAECCYCDENPMDDSGWHSNDVFWVGDGMLQWILCGRHRYLLRTGLDAPRRPGYDNRPSAKKADDEYGGSETLHRTRHQNATDWNSFALLCEIEGCDDAKCASDKYKEEHQTQCEQSPSA